MKELINFIDNDSFSLELLHQSGFTDDFIKSIPFEIKSIYNSDELTKMLYRRAIVNYFDILCLKFNLTKDVLIFQQIKNKEYVALIFNENKIPIDLFMFELYAEPFNQLPYSFKENNIKYVSLELLKVLVDLDLQSEIKKRNKIKIKDIQKTYIMYDEDTDYYKIGKSKDVSFRERTLAPQVTKIKTILVLHYDIESELHDEFAIKRQRGEWFSLTANDILRLIEEYGFKKP